MRRCVSRTKNAGARALTLSTHQERRESRTTAIVCNYIRLYITFIFCYSHGRCLGEMEGSVIDRFLLIDRKEKR